LAKVEQYYALCVQVEEGAERELAFFPLRDDEELGRILGIAVYTTPDGTIQQRHLKRYAGRVVDPMAPHEMLEGDLVVSPVSHENLLAAVQHGYPSSVFLDGQKLAGSVFVGMLKTELGLPIKQPQRIHLKPPEALEEEFILSDDQNPKIVAPVHELKARELERAVGKTIKAVEFGKESSLPEWKHEGEAIVLHFTDGTALSIEVGSNSRNLASDFEGLEPGDMHTDLIPMWRKRRPPT
jgi:hypothetical protein